MEQHIYFHIPKAGGSTLNSIITREYSKHNVYKIHSDFTFDDFLKLKKTHRENIKLFGGIIKFGVHKFLGLETKYFCIIRDPVSRIVSLYNYIQLDKAEGLYKKIPYEHRKDIKSFVENLDKNHTTLQGHNGQSRLLSGKEILDESWDKNLESPKIADNAMGDVAIENIINHFAFIGTLEYFEESLVLMKKYLNWKKPLFYIRRNVTQKRENNISEEVLNLIKEKNSEDMKLYQYVNDKLHQQINYHWDYIRNEKRKLKFNSDLYKFYRKYIRNIIKS